MKFVLIAMVYFSNQPPLEVVMDTYNSIDSCEVKAEYLEREANQIANTLYITAGCYEVSED